MQAELDQIIAAKFDMIARRVQDLAEEIDLLRQLTQLRNQPQLPGITRPNSHTGDPLEHWTPGEDLPAEVHPNDTQTL